MKQKFKVIEEGILSSSEMGKIVGGDEYPGCSSSAYSVVACWHHHSCTGSSYEGPWGEICPNTYNWIGGCADGLCYGHCSYTPPATSLMKKI